MIFYIVIEDNEPLFIQERSIAYSHAKDRQDEGTLGVYQFDTETWKTKEVCCNVDGEYQEFEKE